MSWWKQLWCSKDHLQTSELLQSVRLTLQGWNEDPSSNDMRIWHDTLGDVLSLAILGESLRFPEFSDDLSLQHWARSLAESRGAGLIEVRTSTGALGETLGLIYKRLEKPAYIFTGMLFVPRHAQIWTVVSSERGITGVREAVITSELMNSGKLTIQDYEKHWARDPYDIGYHGADRSVLRFMSDDECYDERFPEHPLSKIRRVMAMLPDSVQIESTNTGMINE